MLGGRERIRPKGNYFGPLRHPPLLTRNGRGRFARHTMLLSSPRKRGPITTDVCRRPNCGPSFAQHEHLWLWVPARASLGRDDMDFAPELPILFSNSQRRVVCRTVIASQRVARMRAR